MQDVKTKENSVYVTVSVGCLVLGEIKHSFLYSNLIPDIKCSILRPEKECPELPDPSHGQVHLTGRHFQVEKIVLTDVISFVLYPWIIERKTPSPLEGFRQED